MRYFESDMTLFTLQMMSVFLLLHAGFTFALGWHKFNQIKGKRGVKFMRVVAVKALRQQTFQFSVGLLTLLYIGYLVYLSV